MGVMGVVVSVDVLVGDSSKARRVLGWSPLFSIEEGLRHTIDWYREFLTVPSITKEKRD